MEGPRTVRDLERPHAIEQERPYEIVKTVTLSGLDYENFVTDLRADRDFIEAHSADCSRGEVWKCPLVRRRFHPGGVLVMPRSGRFVGWAAGLRGKARP